MWKSLIFQEVDLKKFRNLALAYSALNEGGNMPCIMNAANEAAVSAFLKGEIGFTRMPDVVEYAMNNTEFASNPDLDFLEITDLNGRKAANEYINKLVKK